MSGFTLWRVDADLVQPSASVIGAGVTCQTLSDAVAERDKLQANPRYCNVRIERRDYGNPNR